jgi:hypothetical protein
MQEGLYKVSFRTPIGQGDGVVVLEGGQIRGGDSTMYYIGHYTQAGDTFSANVAVATHSHVAGVASVLGVSQGQISLHGTSVGNSATLNGTSPQAPSIGFTATLSRLA